MVNDLVIGTLLWGAVRDIISILKSKKNGREQKN